MKQETVYVRLPDEPIEVYRPVLAALLSPGVYQLEVPSDYDPHLERWEFLPGSRVVCEIKKLSDGLVPVATGIAPE